jgi:enamine deaminase RidA (YjgF/YER057c/UK114 family)
MTRRPEERVSLSVPDSQFPVPAGWSRGSGYSHAVAAEGRQLFIAGQIGWDPVSLKIVPGGIVAQSRQAFTNIAAVLASAGATPAHLVRLTWFITDRNAYLRERTAIGSAYREVLGRHFPAMSVVVVAGLLEPGAEVEIEATAVVPSESGTGPSTGA